MAWESKAQRCCLGTTTEQGPPGSLCGGVCISCAQMQWKRTDPALRILALKKSLTLVSYRCNQYLFLLHQTSSSGKWTWTIMKAQKRPVSLDLIPIFFPSIFNTQAFLLLQIWGKRRGWWWGLRWHLWTGGIYMWLVCPVGRHTCATPMPAGRVVGLAQGLSIFSWR